MGPNDYGTSDEHDEPLEPLNGAPVASGHETYKGAIPDAPSASDAGTADEPAWSAPSGWATVPGMATDPGAPPPTTPGWSAPAPTPAGSNRTSAMAVIAIFAVVLLVVASATGYAIGRGHHTTSTNSNASSFPGGTGSANNGTNSGGSPFGGGSPFNGGFGNFGPSTGDGSSNSGSGTSGSSGSSGTTASATAQKVATAVDPALVDVTSTLPNGTAKGTGMVITSDGEILTNDHVISGATSIHVQFVTTGTTYSASLVGYDASQDVALLKIANVSGLATISTNSSSNVSSGTGVVVIGNAYGQDGTPAVVDGVVVSTNKTITASDEGGFDAETLNGLIEISANVVRGDSGGAVADSSGQVVAMTTAAWSGNASPVSADTAGDAYAIPIDHALSVAHQIEAGQSSSTVHVGEHGLLGVGVGDANGGGAYVGEVQSGSAAEQAGLGAGDTITAVNGTTITSANGLNAAMAATHVGDHVTLQWRDANGASHQATVTLTDGVA